MAASATTKTTTAVNLNSSNTVPTDSTFSTTDSLSYNYSTSQTVYDSLGNEHLVQSYYVKKQATANTTPAGTASTWDVYTTVDGATLASANTQLNFDTSGKLLGTATQTISFTPTGLPRFQSAMILQVAHIQH